MDTLLAGIRRSLPILQEDSGGIAPELVIRVSPFADEYLSRELRMSTYVMLAATLFILLMACANVANLMLTRYLKTRKEIAVMSALGASRTRIAGLVIGEVCLLVIPAATAGLLLSLAAARVLEGFVSSVDKFASFSAASNFTVPDWVGFRPDAMIYLFVIGLFTLSVLVSGLIPGWRASRTDATTVLKDDTRTGTSLGVGRLSHLLVICQIALAVVLLIGTGLALRTVVRLTRLDLNFESDGVFTARVGMFTDPYREDLDLSVRTFTRIVDGLRGYPAIDDAASCRRMPGAGEYTVRVGLPGKVYHSPSDLLEARTNTVSSTFFDTLSVPILRGRGFKSTDTGRNGYVVIVNSLLAEKVWPGEDPLGKRLMTFGWGPDWDTNPTTHTVVGVVPDLKMAGLVAPRPSEPGMYFPILQKGSHPQDPENVFVNFILVKTASEAASILPTLREEVLRNNPDAPIYWPKWMNRFLHEQMGAFSIMGVLFLTFGLVALFLATFGLYAVVSFSVAQRTREVGIRLALGASHARVTGMILRESALRTAIGLAMGIAIALGTVRFMNAILLEESPYDPLIFTLVPMLVAGVSLIAAYLPARRVASVNPAEALRYE